MRFRRNIHITSIKQPNTGSVFAMHCEKCERTVIMWSQYMNRPEKGDFWGLEGVCEHPLHGCSVHVTKLPFSGGNVMQSSIIYGSRP